MCVRAEEAKIFYSMLHIQLKCIEAIDIGRDLMFLLCTMTLPFQGSIVCLYFHLEITRPSPAGGHLQP